MSERGGWFGEHDALWSDPKPTTPEGQHLWRLFMLGKLGTSPSGIRDFGQRICQIEAEAALAHAAPERLDRTALASALHDSYQSTINWPEPRGTIWHDACEEMADIVIRRYNDRLALSQPDATEEAGRHDP